MAGQANDTEKLPWLEPYREPGETAARPAEASSKAVEATVSSRPGPAPSRGRGAPLAAWLATGVVVVALAGGGGYWIGHRSVPAAPAAIPAAAPTVTIPVAKVEPIPMPDVEPTEGGAPPSAVRASARPVREARPARRVVRQPVRRAQARSSVPPSRPQTAPPLPKAMAVQLIRQGSAGPPGTVVDLGRYLSPRLADSAFKVTAGRYPYLGGLKRVVVPMPPVYGQPRLYALQVGAKSTVEARQLCDNLVKIGRPCIVR